MKDAFTTPTLARHLATNQAINTYPYGTRFLPQNIDPTTNTPLNDNYLRPYPGYAEITERTRLGSSNYHALKCRRTAGCASPGGEVRRSRPNRACPTDNTAVQATP